MSDPINLDNKIVLACVVGLLLVSACMPPEESTATAYVRTILTKTPAPLTPTESSQEYLPVYDPLVEPIFPPYRGIWRNSLPLPVLDSTPQFIHHPPPFPPLDQKELGDVGCWVRGTSDIRCASSSPLFDLDCDLVVPGEDYQQGDIAYGLTPDIHVLAACYYEPDFQNAQDDVYLYQVGCELAHNVGYVIQIDDRIRIIKDPADFQSLVGTVEDADEAISYALLMSGLEYRHDFEVDIPRDLIYFYLEVIEDSHVTPIEDGYLVHLYHEVYCGCGPFITSQVDVLIHTDGTLEWFDARPAYATEPYLCID